jgi:hypothetical protein
VIAEEENIKREREREREEEIFFLFSRNKLTKRKKIIPLL